MIVMAWLANIDTGNEADDRSPTVRWQRFAGEPPDLANFGEGLDYWPEALRELR